MMEEHYGILDLILSNYKENIYTFIFKFKKIKDKLHACPNGTGESPFFDVSLDSRISQLKCSPLKVSAKGGDAAAPV